MKRILLEKLNNWKQSDNRKPLIIRGARQVGKTWLIREFGQTYYSNMVYINFESTKSIRNIFQGDFDVQRMIRALQIESGINIIEDKTLIFFDEIQECPEALTSLKYFYEDNSSYHIIAAGSLLGVSIHKNNSFPVGKVDFLDLYPMNFGEFLLAIDQQRLYELLLSGDWKLITGFKQKFIDLLRLYYFVGGMPEAVQSYILNEDFDKVRQIQQNILLAYENDFSKHAPVEVVPRIRLIWQSVISQMAKENKKFIYGMLKSGARAKDFELALNWLIDAGLIYKIHRVAKPAIPLASYLDFSAFKIFITDVGLLGALGQVNSKALIDGISILKEFKGSMSEQFVLQQLKSLGFSSVFYWSAEKSESEIDFIVQYKENIIPIEVKAEENLQAKSLKSFRQQFQPGLSVRVSMSDYRDDGWLLNVPLYAQEAYWK
jgi:uncharacterized protein